MAKILKGKVVSVKMKNTVTVRVEKKMRHPLYRKVVTKHKKYKVHVDENMSVKEGDNVVIKETKPISKDKHFIIIENLAK